jgi:hypothetical protein
MNHQILTLQMVLMKVKGFKKMVLFTTFQVLKILHQILDLTNEK